MGYRTLPRRDRKVARAGDRKVARAGTVRSRVRGTVRSRVLNIMQGSTNLPVIT